MSSYGAETHSRQAKSHTVDCCGETARLEGPLWAEKREGEREGGNQIDSATVSVTSIFVYVCACVGMWGVKFT